MRLNYLAFIYDYIGDCEIPEKDDPEDLKKCLTRFYQPLKKWFWQLKFHGFLF